MEPYREPNRPKVHVRDNTQGPASPRLGSDPSASFYGRDPERKSRDKIWSRGSHRSEEVNIAPLSRAQITLVFTIRLTNKAIGDGGAGPLQRDNANDRESLESKSRRRGLP